MQYVLNPVCLPARDRIPSTRKELSTIYGYGVIYDKDAWIFKETTPDFLQKADLYVQGCLNNTMFCNVRRDPTDPGLCNVSI